MTQPKYPPNRVTNQGQPDTCTDTEFDLDIYVRGRLRDTGCECSPSCLSCPLPVCVHDLPPRETLRIKKRWSDQAIALSVFSGMPVEQVACREGVTVRTVYKAIKRVREDVNGRAN